MNKRFCPTSSVPSRDAGVALIFALAVLALLLVMLIGFLASSILEHRIAYNQSSEVASRIAVRSALARAEVQLLNYSDPAWFRSLDNTKAVQPLVSVDGTLAKTTQANSAYPEMKRLLKKYLAPPPVSGSDSDDTLKNWFPNADTATTEDYYPQWIYLEADGRLTGRFAYAIVPSLGINPALFGTGATERKGGVSFEELPISGLAFLTAAGQTTVKQPYGTAGFTDWMSLDLLSGGRGLWADASFTKTGVATEFATGKVTNRELVNAYFSVDMLKAEEKSVNDKWLAGAGDDRTDLSQKITFSQAQTLLSHIDDSHHLRDQVAANLADYTDEDDTPTSDVAPGNWKTTAPTYTGNEMTPYINQVVPTLHFTVTYNETKLETTPASGSTPAKYKVTQTVKVEYQADVATTLVNIYPKTFSGNADNKVFLKNLDITFTTSAVEGEADPPDPLSGTGNAPEEKTLNQTSQEAVFHDKMVTSAGTEVAEFPAHSYVRSSSPKTSLATVKTFNREFTNKEATDDIPKLTIQVQVSAVTVGPAILEWVSKKSDDSTAAQQVDYVASLSGGSVATNNIAIFDGKKVSEFSASYEKVETPELFLGFEVDDPRCNLAADQWNACTPVMLMSNLGKKNADTDAQNTDPTKEKDLEPDSDPVNLSTAYIRNGAMESPWELAFIHRGAPWQTVNLRSAVSPLESGYSGKEKNYFNDGILWDKIKFSANAEDYKFNLNLPAQYESAFGVLPKGLKYHDPAQPLAAVGGALDVTSGTALPDAAAQELKQWIANKCYDAGGADPTAGEAYQRYIHRGMLANVIFDWARRGDNSPYKSTLKEAHLSELIAKIVPLVRCGDTYEYFTVFAVGQAIKDVGSSGGSLFYKYGSDGKITGTPQACALGTYEKDFDQITAESYLVARIRREVESCEGKESCKLGIHDPACTFKLTVLESYTLDEP